MKRIISLLALIFSVSQLFAQSASLPLDSDKYHLLDRLDIKYGQKNNVLHSSVKPYSREEIVEFLESIEDSNMSNIDKENIDYFLTDSWEFVSDSTKGLSKKAFLKEFYTHKPDLYSHHEKAFDLHISPVLYFAAGKETKDGDNLYINSRGVELRGQIDGKVGFYSFIAENQVQFPNYVNQLIFRNNRSAVPGENYWKFYKDNKGYDFFTARGYITFNATKHINFKFGHDKNMIGNGYRSLILSDNAGNYPFLKVQVKVWKIKYTSMFADLVSGLNTIESNGALKDGAYPRKFLASHHLGIDLFKNFNLGLFEHIVYSNGDSSTTPAYDINYFNPIIFYRSIEQNLGSSGNAILGMDFKWDLWKTVSLYGQVFLDEFKLDEIKSGEGWWANKYGIQGGAKYIDAFGLKNFDLQGEVNIVRPYTYSHTQKSTSFTHFHQPMAHPLGANFNEVIGIMRHQATKKLFFAGKLMYAVVGYDSTGTNVGQDLLKPNSDRDKEYGNVIGQGVQSKVAFADLTVSYMLKHNLFIDWKTTIRKEKSQNPLSDLDTFATLVAFRWNIGQRLNEF